jgi:hypothetical protein
MQSKVIVVAPANEITSMCYFAQIASTFSWQIEQQLLVGFGGKKDDSKCDLKYICCSCN